MVNPANANEVEEGFEQASSVEIGMGLGIYKEQDIDEDYEVEP